MQLLVNYGIRNSGASGLAEPTIELFYTTGDESVFKVTSTAKEEVDFIYEIDNQTPSLFSRKVFPDKTIQQASVAAVRDYSTTQSNADVTTLAVNMPTSVESDDLLVMVLSVDGNPTVTPPQGWTNELERRNYSGQSFYIFTKQATGTEGGTTDTITLSSVEQIAAIVYSIKDYSYYKFSQVVVSTSLNPAPYRVAVKDNADLFLTLGAINRSDYTVSAYPTDFTNGINVTSGSTTAGANVFGCQRTTTTNDLTPSPLTLSTSTAFVVVTMAFKGIPEKTKNQTFVKVNNLNPSQSSIVYGYLQGTGDPSPISSLSFTTDAPFEVVFKDESNQSVGTGTVNTFGGSLIVPPNTPEKSGFYLTGWNNLQRFCVIPTDEFTPIYAALKQKTTSSASGSVPSWDGSGWINGQSSGGVVDGSRGLGFSSTGLSTLNWTRLYASTGGNVLASTTGDYGYYVRNAANTSNISSRFLSTSGTSDANDYSVVGISVSGLRTRDFNGFRHRGTFSSNRSGTYGYSFAHFNWTGTSIRATVRFVNPFGDNISGSDDNVILNNSSPQNGIITPPTPPSYPGKTFVGWSFTDFNNILQSVAVYPTYQ